MAVELPNRIIDGLSLLTWRGLQAPPYDNLPFEWTNSLAPRRVPYVDGTMHDNTGRESFPMRARLFFCNGLDGRNDLYPDLWEEWRDALLDASPGDLVHPILGKLRARPLHVGGELKASIRSGVIIDVTFIETLEDPTRPTQLLAGNVSTAAVAAAADQSASAFGIAYPDGSYSTSILGAFKAISGSVFSLELSVNGAINQVLGSVSSMIDSVDMLDDHDTWSARDNLVSAWHAFKELGDKIGVLQSRGTSSVVLQSDTTLDQFATSVGNSLSDVMGLNLAALKAPKIKRGSTLRYYTGK